MNNVCPKCGKERNTNLNFCNNCGAVITDATSNVTSITSMPTVQQPVQPMEPVQPVTPVQPIQPVEPVAPVESAPAPGFQPVKPMTSTQPLTSVKPTDGEKKKLDPKIIIIALVIIVGVIVGVVIFNKKKTTGDPVVDNMLKGSLIPVKIDDKYGYINTKGKVVIAAEYDSAESFKGSHAFVRKGSKYQFIDRDGNVKLEFDYIYPKYIEENGLWIIKDELYNDKLDKISPTNAKVKTVYENYDYFTFTNTVDKKAGLLDVNGKVLWQIELQDEDKFSVSVADIEFKELTPYCAVKNGSQGLFVNCTTGKQISTFDASRVEYASCTEDNVCYLRYNDGDEEYPGEYVYYYFQDDQKIIETDPKKYSYISSSIEYSGYIRVSGRSGEKDLRYDVCNKEFMDGYTTSCKLTPKKVTFSDYSEYTINDDMSITKEEEEKIPKGRYSSYKTFNKRTYTYLLANKKDYIVGVTSSNASLIDLTTGKEIYDLPKNTSLSSDSTFIELADYDDGTAKYYNVLSNKVYTFDTKAKYYYSYVDYIAVVTEDNVDLYDVDFKKFYTIDRSSFVN